MPFWSDVSGHAWTVWPQVRDRLVSGNVLLARRLQPPTAPESEPWSAEVRDPTVGPVRLSGRIAHLPGARALVVILHGMGGSAERTYCAGAAAAARACGMSSLRLNLRGADGSGEDLYHIGLVDDLAAALEHPEVARYPDRYALGFSLGGHIALRMAALGGDRLRAIAAVCAPLDLEGGVAHLDHPARWAYRMHLLNGVKEVYRRVAARRPVPTPLDSVMAIRSIRSWDEKVVAPRFGFAGASDYYRQAAVASLLPDLATPALFVASENDPMIPPRTLRPLLEPASSALEVRWLQRGGHVGFPGEFRLMMEILGWFAEH
jgi:predicted alpha/beta-fold hydrolase